MSKREKTIAELKPWKLLLWTAIAGLIFGGGNINNANPLDLTNILWSLLGAVILLAIVNLIRRGTVR